MATAQLDTLLRHIHKLAASPPNAHWSDRQLLDDFASRHEETAFTTLLARHGPMVLRVCRRVLHHEQDAEDAFQATFLVLAKNTTSIRRRDALAGWLHGVAYRTAMKAKRSAARRRNHEAQLRDRRTDLKSVPPTHQHDPSWHEVRAALDEEIQRLPAHHRSAFVACILEGKSVPEAAAELASKAGTVSSWLARARTRLRLRLARRGIELSALLAALAVAESAEAGMPATLAQETVRIGLLVAAGRSAAGVIPSHIAALAAGVTRAMFVTKTKIAIVVALAVGLLGVGAQTAGTGIGRALSVETGQESATTPRTAHHQDSQTPAKGKASPKKETKPPVALDPDDPLDLALLRWQKAIDKIETASCKLSRTNKDDLFKIITVYEGTFKYRKPKQWVLELRRKDKPEEFEKLARDGKFLYQYLPKEKEIIEHEVPERLFERKNTTWFERLLRSGFVGAALNVLESHSLLGIKPEDAKRRYSLKLTKGKENDPYYSYMDMQPHGAADKADFETGRLVLSRETHLPRQYWFRRPNGDETTWDIPKIETGVELTGDDFKLTVPKGWRLRKLTSPQIEKNKEALDQKDK
jgi:RNA polymerase sigma factor (sigma-70 family)